MKRQLSRRDFVKSSLIASAGLPLAMNAQSPAPPPASSPPPSNPPAAAPDKMPTGRIGGEEFSRLILGGNLIGGCAHSRDLAYVATLARRYNTPAKIRETLEVAEAHGINAINTHATQDNTTIFEHWKNGGKIKWFAQVGVDSDGGYSQIDKAVDEGAAGLHVWGNVADSLLRQNKTDKIGQMVKLIKDKKHPAGVGAHDLRVIVECEKAGFDVDFYQKTFHSHDYYTAPRAGETEAVGPNDNSWCNDPQAVIDVFAKTAKPWIAFKILAAGAIPPLAAFPYAFTNGADFILVGMFDWQVEENAKLARRVLRVASGPNSKRTRPWYGGNAAT